jgi:hypothetical protein
MNDSVWRRFTLDQLPAEPWRNGGGVTRALASGDATADAPWSWRVSVATIERDGAFSCFAGVDRTSMLIGGEQLVLDDPAGHTVLHIGLHETGRYPGDAQLQARVQGAPLQCLNVMVRRQRAQARVTAVSHPETPESECVLLVLRGGYGASVQCGPALTVLYPGQGLHVPAGVGLTLQPLEAFSLLAMVEILPFMH